MPKDYARYVNQSKRPVVKQGWRGRLLRVMVILFLVGGAGFGYFVYNHDQHDQESISFVAWFKQLKTFFNSEKPAAKETMAELKEQEDSQNSDIQFSFYTELPTMQVSAPPVAVEKPVGTQAKPVENTSLPQKTVVAEAKYLLQIAAFKNPSAAGEMRISLLLAGFEVEIVKAARDNQVIYQLQQGPFATLSEAKSMQQQLKRKGMESVIVKKVS